jgi:hypothetical protein
MRAMETGLTSESEFSIPGGTELLTVTRAAAELGLTSRTLINYFEQGIGPARTRVGTRVFVTRFNLHAWLRENTERSAA